MECPKCAAMNPEGKKFCRNCGGKLTLRCPQCASELVPGDKFCGECGQPLDALKGVAKIDYSTPQSYTPKHLADKILTNRTPLKANASS